MRILTNLCLTGWTERAGLIDLWFMRLTRPGSRQTGGRTTREERKSQSLSPSKSPSILLPGGLQHQPYKGRLDRGYDLFRVGQTQVLGNRMWLRSRLDTSLIREGKTIARIRRAKQK